MSYHNQDRKKGNGYGIIITGYAGDAHYDRLGADRFDAEAIRSDNLRTMDADMVEAERTLSDRVPLSIMETYVEQQEAAIKLDAQLIKAEIDAQRIVVDGGIDTDPMTDTQMRFPVDPGRDPAAITADIPEYPRAGTVESIMAADLTRQAVTRDIQSA
ncbi:MAG: hypothetical protein JRD89_14260, partial [Deltaproteobacteria bacterium]|nr:hypothetical protein [Deltaproteobacteria bacterium]